MGPDFSELFSEEKHYQESEKIFLMLAGAGMKKFGLELKKEQEVLISIADIMIEIYMAESAILRTENLKEEIIIRKVKLQ